MRRLFLALLASSSFGISGCNRTTSAVPSATVSGADSVDGALAQPHVQSGDPSVVSQSLETEAQIEPTLALTQDGRVAIAWMSALGEHTSIIGVRFSTDGGSTWTAVQAIRSPENRTASHPVLAADPGGNIYLAWVATGPNGPGGVADSHVYVARADARGGPFAFGPSIDVSDRMHRGAKLFKPGLVATANGAVVVTWGYASSLGNGIAVARSVDGSTWAKELIIERIGLKTSLPAPCASAHGDRVWVTYLDAEAGVRMRASDDGGITWSPARTATVSTADDRARIGMDTPVCAGDGEEVTVAYGLSHDTKSPVLDAIVVAKSYDGGRVFDSRRTLEGGTSAMMHPQIAREYDGALDLAYYAAGSTPETGALRWVRTEGDRSPLAGGKVARANFRFEPSAEQHFWPGDYFGWAWRAGTLYAASIDNSADMPHVAFTRIPAK